MAHHAPDATAISDVLEHLIENGLDGMASAIEILLNEAMRLERSEFLRAGPYERNAERRAPSPVHENGRMTARMGFEEGHHSRRPEVPPDSPVKPKNGDARGLLLLPEGVEDR